MSEGSEEDLSFVADDDEEVEAQSSSSSAEEEDEVAALTRSQRDAPLLGPRRRIAVKRLDPSRRSDDEEEDASSESVNAEDEDGEEAGDEVVLMDDDANNGAQAELKREAEEFRVWIRSTRGGRGGRGQRSISTWSELARSGGWFGGNYGEQLSAIRGGLGVQNRVQHIAQGHWDRVYEEMMTTTSDGPHLEKLDFARKEKCIFCAGTKPCSFQLYPGDALFLGLFCAKLMEAWINWCTVFSVAVQDDLSDRDATVANVASIKLAFDLVKEAHENKSAGPINRRKKQQRNDEEEDL